MTSNAKTLAKLKEDIQLRGLSQNTVDSYVLNAGIFLKYCGKPAEQLSETDIRDFIRHLISEKKLAPKSVNTYSAAIRFLFAVTLGRTLNYLQIPRQKVPKTYPALLSREEIAAIMESCHNLKHRAMLSLAYGSGLRVSEIAALKTQHIDSRNMRLLIEKGKGNKSRYTLLSEECLSILRDYWRRYRPAHPEGWLFTGVYNVKRITEAAIEDAFERTAERAGITKDVSIHSLRHAFATHLLEDGADILQIKELLGHASIHSTTVYLHLANLTADLKSPLDHVSGGRYA